MSTPTINLPLPVLIQSIFCLAMGTYQFLAPHASTRTAELKSGQGSFLMGIGFSYLATAYMPIEKNQFLHASIPGRLIVASLCLLKAGWRRKSLSSEAINELVVVAIVDGGLALYLGS